MDDDPRHDEEGAGDHAAEAPDLATLLTDTVRSAALELPRDRVLPVVYVACPFPEDPPG